MKNKLNALRQFVVEQLHSKSDFITADAPEHWASTLPKIKDDLLLELKALVLSKKDNQLIKRHIWYTQKECISLLDLLPATLPGSNDKSIEQLAHQCLEEILEYIFETHGYPEDLDVYTPAQHLLASQARITGDSNLLKAALRSKKVNPELQSILINAYSRFVKLKQATYQQLHYMEKLLFSIIKLCNQVNCSNFDDLLVEHLIYFGFNESAFVLFCKNFISREVDQIYQIALRFDKLCFYEKQLLAQQEKAHAAFSVYRLSVKTQLLAFVQAELNYFKRKHEFEIHCKSPQHGEMVTASAYRVKVNLSADSLAYLIRLLCDTAVIEANPRTKLMEFIARHFQTAGIGDKQLSAQSLGTKYKQVTQSTATGLKTLLNRMAKQIDKEFGKH